MLRWGCNIGGEQISQFNKPGLGSLLISIVSIEIIAEGFDFRQDLKEFISCHFDNVFPQELLFPELSLLDLSSLLKFPFLFSDEMGQHVTLTRSQIEIRHRSIWVLVPEINVI